MNDGCAAFSTPSTALVCERGLELRDALAVGRDPLEAEREARGRLPIRVTFDQIAVDAIPNADAIREIELDELANAKLVITAELLLQPAAPRDETARRRSCSFGDSSEDRRGPRGCERSRRPGAKARERRHWDVAQSNAR
jgi:hypothetical protein